VRPEPGGSAPRLDVEVPDSLRVAPPAATLGRGFRLFQLGASLSLVIACVLAVDLRSVVEELRSLDLRWLGAAFCLHLAQLGLLALRWTVIARALGLALEFRRAIGEYALSVFVNQVLPGGIAGDGLRAVRHARSSTTTSVLRAVEALAIDRASGQVAFWVAVLLTAPLAITNQILEPHVLGTLLAAFAGLTALLWFLLDRFAPASGQLARLRRSLRRAALILLHPRHVAAHLPISFAFVAVTLMQFHVAARALGEPLELAQLVWLGPLILSAASIPSFFGGWGIREGASAVLFGAAGLPGSRGVAVSVVYGLFGLLVSALGLLLFLAAGRRPRRQLPDSGMPPLAPCTLEAPAENPVKTS
jgi:uncharacterized protein (TIRG00374 family)